MFNTIDDLWYDAAKHVVDKGSHLNSRDGGSLEVVGWRGVLANPQANFLRFPGRALSPFYACAELLWYLSMDSRVDMIAAYAPSYQRFADPDGTAYGHYGRRWLEGDKQLEGVIALLQAQPNTRQAVITMWRASDLTHARIRDKPDLPCTLSMQFLAREGKLHAVVTMRSNDLWLGLPYDIWCFTCIQSLIADELGLALGTYTHQVGSLHAYDRNLDKLHACIDNYDWDQPDWLSHTWVRARMQDVRTAVIAEKATRLGHGAELPPQGTLLSDAVLVCIHKWCPDSLMFPHSPILKEALYAHRRRT